MNTQEYINELKIHLRKLSDDDREDAISYYFEYLAEAGPEGVADAMKKLGSPAELAAGIRADQAIQDFKEVERPGGAAVEKGVRAVWLAGLAAVPRTILAVFVSIIIIIVFFAVMIALFATSVGLMGGGVIALGSGIWMINMDWTTAMFYGGWGLVAAACGFLLFIFSVWCSKGLLHGIVKVFNGIRRKREATRDSRAATGIRGENTPSKSYGMDIGAVTPDLSSVAETPEPSSAADVTDPSSTVKVTDPSSATETAEPSSVTETADPSSVAETIDNSAVEDLENEE